MASFVWESAQFTLNRSVQDRILVFDNNGFGLRPAHITVFQDCRTMVHGWRSLSHSLRLVGPNYQIKYEPRFPVTVKEH